MTEGDLPQRPNANYNLSKPDTEVVTDEPLTFYYNREHRLAKAPQAVKDLYAGNKNNKGFNLLRPLVADRPRAMLFFTIVVLCLAVIVLSILGYFDKAYSLDGNKLEISAIEYEGMAIVMVKKTIKGRSPYTGAVDIAVSPMVHSDEDYQVFSHRIFFSLESEEKYRFTVPFDSPVLLMALQTEKNSLNIKVNID